MFDTLPPQVAYTIQEACRQLGCKPHRIYRAISNRQLDARKIGTRVVITGASMQSYVAGWPRVELKRNPSGEAAS